MMAQRGAIMVASSSLLLEQLEDQLAVLVCNG